MSSRYYLTNNTFDSLHVQCCKCQRLMMPGTGTPADVTATDRPSSSSVSSFITLLRCSACDHIRCYFMKHRAHLSSRISQETGNNKFFSGLHSCCLLHNSFTMVLSSVSLVRFVSVWLKDKKIQRPSGSWRHGNSPTTEPTGWFMMRKTSESDWWVGRADVSYYICISWWMRSHSTDVLTHQRFYTHWTEI